MKKYIILLSVMLSALAAVAQRPAARRGTIFSGPDFAYPQTVIADADSVLRVSTDPSERFQAMMSRAVAVMSIDTDSVNSVVAGIERFAATAPAGWSSLACLYEASVVARYYSASRWKYDQVTSAPGPLPADMAMWSGDQFRQCVGSLVDKAIATLGDAGRMPLSSFADVITINDASKPFYPWLRDMVYITAISCLSEVNDGEAAEALNGKILALTEEGTPEWAQWYLNADKPALAAYEKCSDSLAAAALLLDACRRTGENGLSEERAAGLLRAYLDKEPVNVITGALECRFKELTAPQINFEVPDNVVPGRPFTVTFNGKCATTVEVVLYRLKNGGGQNRFDRLAGAEKIDSKIFTFGSMDFNLRGSVNFTTPEAGTYGVAVVVDDDRNSSRSSLRSITSTPVAPLLLGSSAGSAFVAVDARVDAPMRDAELWIGGKRIGVTDRDGIIPYFRNDYNRDDNNIYVVKDGKRYDLSLYLPGSRRFNTDGVTARFFVDRPLYHQGDTVRWAVVAGRYDNSVGFATASRDIELTVAMFDANRQPVDTVAVTTDGYGRASGSFVIPSDRLTGDYTLRLVGTSYAQLRPRGASASFTVSDFKLPTFDVRDLKVDFAADSSVVVSGRAMTLSGMAVSDGRVSVQLTPMPVWWRYVYGIAEDAEDITMDGVTDAEGRFSVTVPAGKYSRNFNYNVTATVTSRAAEVATASTSFAVSREAGVRYYGPAYVDIDKTKRLEVCAVDPLGRRVSADASWTLISDSVAVASGRCALTPAGADIDLSRYPVGVYRLAVTPDGRRPMPCDTISLTTYSPARNAVPASVGIFVPDANRSVTPDTPAKFKVGVGRKSTVYVFTFNGDVITSAERRVMNPGFNEVTVPAIKAGGTAKVTVALYTPAGYVVETTTFTATDPRTLRMTMESWRDNMTPGNRETVTVRLSHSDGTPVEGAVVATMYNRALELVGTGLPTGYGVGRRLFPFFDYASFDTWYCCTISFDSRVPGWYYDMPRCNSVADIERPSFRYADFNSHVYRYLARSMAAPTAGMGDVSADVMYSNMEFDAAAAPEAVEEEPMMYKEAATDMVADLADEGAPRGDAEVEYRASEVLQALWMPMLTTGADGSATITFTAPNANGSWRFLAAAWNADLFAAGIDTTAVTSKPVMVQPNAPRFLRAGDRAEVAVSVFNNSGADGAVTTSYEILDASTGKVIGSESSSRSIAAGASAVFTVPLSAVPGRSAVVMRVRATLGDFTDGEQTVIPVLASGLTVIDSETFYLTGSKPLYASVLPSGKNSTVTLMYCGNPVWDVVKALPAIYDYRPLTATDAASALYGALTARGLNRRFPEIRRAIDIWESNPQDSALVSRLMLNENLKLAALQQTPWVWAAASETERMQRLSLTFDPAQIKEIIGRAVTVLENLQRSDGGFSWGSWSDESSFWTTATVLRTLGRLNSAGFLSGNVRLDAVIDKAFRYLDSHIGKDDDIAYAFVASLFPTHKPTTVSAENALHAGAQYAVHNWKSAPTALKARYAMLLYATGYDPVAREIIGAVRQFAVRSPEAGISFPSVDNVDAYATILEAFATIDPQAAELDEMRKWLVLRTQVTDDLGTWDPVGLISAILSTGTRWTTLRAADAAVRVGDVPVTVDNVESITGTFSTVIRDAAGQTVTVCRPSGAGVSYGSVTSVSTVALDSVAPRGSSELSITKRFLVERDGRYVETSAFVPGERVRVQLTVRASRDMEYVTVIDERPATFEPVDQLPGFVYASALAFYRENADSQTRLFISWMPRGTWQIEYDMTVTAAGAFASGPATVQSQYAPELNARSGSRRVSVER